MKYCNFEDIPLVLSVEDLADTLDIGRNKAYTLVSTGRIRTLRLGNHYRIPRESFISFLRGEGKAVS